MKLGEASKQVRMIKAISTQDLSSPALRLPLRLLRQALPQLQLVDAMTLGCITPKNQPTAGTIYHAIEKRKIDDVIGASTGTIREAKRQRAWMEKKTAPIDPAHCWRKAVSNVKHSYRQELEAVWEEKRNPDDTTVDIRFGLDDVRVYANDAALAKIYGENEDEYLSFPSEKPIQYSDRMTRLTKLLGRVRRDWVAAKNMALQGCRTQGTAFQASYLLTRRFRRRSGGFMSPAASHKAGALRSAPLFDDTTGPPQVGCKVVLTNGAAVTIEKVQKVPDNTHPELAAKVRHIDGDIVEISCDGDGGGDGDEDVTVINRTSWIPLELFRKGSGQNARHGDIVINNDKWESLRMDSAKAQQHSVSVAGVGSVDQSALPKESQITKEEGPLSHPDIKSGTSRFSAEKTVTQRAAVVEATLGDSKGNTRPDPNMNVLGAIK